MAAADGVVFQSAGGALIRRNIVNHDIGAGQEVIQGSAVSAIAEIESDAALVRVKVLEQAALFRIWNVAGERAAVPGDIAFGRFDFNHAGAHQRHQLGGKRRRNALTEFDY